jgi:hypothetical protein
MPLSTRTKTWFESLRGALGPTKTKAAERLFGLSERYFDDKKVTIPEREQLIELLAPLVSDSELVVRKCVAQLLGLLQVRSSTACEVISKLLGDKHPEVQVHAVWAGGRLGRSASSLIPHIALLATSASHDVRWRVAWALGEMGQATPETHGALLHLSHDQSYLTRMHSLDSMAKCADAANFEMRHALLSGLDDLDPTVRSAACRSIGSLPWDWSDHRAKIRQLALHDGVGGNFYAMLALAKLDPNCIKDPPVREWLESNRQYGWVNDLFADA